MGKCEVLTLEEYSVLGFIHNSIYFTRAAYDMETQKLTPNIFSEDQKKFCFCEAPYNPDLEWVECEECSKWFHNDCVIKLNYNLKDFKCSNCSRKESISKKKKK